MKKYLYICLLIGLLFTTQVFGAELRKITKLGSGDSAQIFFTFDTIPQFSLSNYKRRIDINFSNATYSTETPLFATDTNIVKLLPRTHGNDFVLSLYLRYLPQQYKISTSEDGKVVFEVLFGNKYSKEYKKLANKLKGITVGQPASINLQNPLYASPYKKDWTSFFRLYEPPLSISLPVQFTLAPFPIIELLPPGYKKNRSLLTDEMYELARKNLWVLLGNQILEKIKSSNRLEELKQLALTYGEVLARGGDFENSFKQLYLLKEKYNTELIGTYANYLLLFIRAKYEDPYIASDTYEDFKYQVNKNNLLRPYIVLSQIETALATGNNKRLNDLLQIDDIAYPPDIASIYLIRQSDYWHAIQNPIRAFASYNLHKDSSALLQLPYSLSGYCSTLFLRKKYQQAAKCYEQLGNLTDDKKELGKILYRKGISKLRFSSDKSMEGEFNQVANTFSKSEGGLRAAIKLTDLRYLNDKNYAKIAIRNYTKVSQTAVNRDVKSEALFKKALVYCLSGDTLQGIKILQKLLRDFRVGDIRPTAQALLIQYLPNAIEELVEDKKYIEALVLAKKNKILFEKKWLDPNLFLTIANTYYNAGIFNEAHDLYLYMIEISAVEQKEKYFLPLIQSAFDQGNYSLVDDYSAQYTYNYPDGKFAKDVLFLRIQSLVAKNFINEALDLLPSPLPSEERYYKLAANLFFRTNNYKQCVAAIDSLRKLNILLNERTTFIDAESNYQVGQLDQAATGFQNIDTKSHYYEQSVYRLAEIERKRGNEKNALSLFTKIVETGKRSHWVTYAQKELLYADANKKIRENLF